MPTPNLEKIEADMAFLSEALGQRNEQKYTSITISILWATIVAIGCLFNDFYHQYAGWYWLVAPLLGFFTSFYLGSKAAQACGTSSTRDRRKAGLHWGSLFFVFIAVLSIAYTHHLDGWVVGQIFMLISGIGSYMAGLHIDKRFLYPGIVMVIGAAAVDYVGPYPWTVIGFAFAISLVISAIKMRPQYETA